MKLDINLVWQQASTAVAANREVLLALAGVFILLPRLAFELFAPPAPETHAALDINAMAQVMQAYYASVAPWLLAVALVETTGTLALLTLFTDRTRPTVGLAIRRGAAAVLPYLVAQILFVLGLAVVGGAVLGLAGISGSKQFAGVVLGGQGYLAAFIRDITQRKLLERKFRYLVLGTVLFWATYAGLRLVVLAPVIVVDRARGPLAAIGRAWRLTRGNAGRIFALLLLFVVVMVVAMMAVSGVIGSLGALVAGANTAHIAVAVAASVLSSTFTVYLVAVLAAIHRQLASAMDGRP